MGGARVKPLSGSDAAAGPAPTQEEGTEEEAAWKQFYSGRTWFSHLRIARDGGFSEVHVLFTTDRFLWALLAIAFLGMNLWVLFYPNIYALANLPFIIEVQMEHGYLINWMLQAVFDRGLNPRVMLALLELGLLAVLIGRTVCSLLPVVWGRPERRWHGVAQTLWFTLPDLMTFSAMRLLNFVAPSVLLPAISDEFTASKDRHWNRMGIPLLKFVLLRLLFAFVGFEAFMCKFLDTANTVSTSSSGLNSIIVSIAFLNQILGIVQITPLVQHRLFVYIFGGEDSFMTDRENQILKVWCARLAKHIWEEAVRAHSPAILWFLAVMLAYSDIDFQRLTLNENGVLKLDAACGTEKNIDTEIHDEDLESIVAKST